MNMPDYLPPSDGKHALPLTPELIHTINCLFTEIAQPGTCISPDELARWFDIIRRGNIDIEDLERIDTHIEETDHGSVKIKIAFREVSGVSFKHEYRKQRRRHRQARPISR